MPSVYHVCGTCGNDANAGSAAAPWATIDKSTSIADDDDVVYWHTGTYREKPVCDHGAVAGHPITFIACPDLPCTNCTITQLQRGRVRITGCDANEQASAGTIFDCNWAGNITIIGNRGLWIDGSNNLSAIDGQGATYLTRVYGVIASAKGASNVGAFRALYLLDGCIGFAKTFQSFTHCLKHVGCIGWNGFHTAIAGQVFINCLALFGTYGFDGGDCINCMAYGCDAGFIQWSTTGSGIKGCVAAFCTTGFNACRLIASNYGYMCTTLSTGCGGDAAVAGYEPGLNLHAVFDLLPIMSVAERDKGTNGLCSPGKLTSAAAGGTGITVATWWRYKVTYTDATGETEGGAVSTDLTFSNKSGASLTAIPTGPPSVTGRKVYRTADGGSSYYLLTNGSITDNTTTILTDTTTDATLVGNAAMPSTNTTAIYSATDTDILGLIRMTDGTGTGTAVPDIGPWCTANWSVSRAAADIYSAGPAHVCNAEGERIFKVHVNAGETLTAKVWTKVASGTTYGRMILRGYGLSDVTATATGASYEQLSAQITVPAACTGGMWIKVICYARAQANVNTYFSDFSTSVA